MSGPAASGTGVAAGADTATGFAPTGATTSAPNTLRGGTAAMPDAVRSQMTTGLNQQASAITAGTGAATAAAAPAAAAAAGGGGLMSFLGTETGGNIISGLGQGAMAWYENKQKDKQLQMQAEEYDKQRAAELDKEMRTKASYQVDPSVYHSASSDTTVRPTPAEKYSRKRFEYDPSAGRVVLVEA